MENEEKNTDITPELESSKEFRGLPEHKETTDEIYEIQKKVAGSLEKLIYTNESAFKNLDDSQRKFIEAISSEKPSEKEVARTAAKLRREAVSALRERIEEAKKTHELKCEAGRASEQIAVAELRAKQAEKKAEEAKSLARKWGRLLSTPLIAAGEGTAAILKGVGEGAGKALAGIYYAIKERRLKHKRKVAEMNPETN